MQQVEGKTATATTEQARDEYERSRQYDGRSSNAAESLGFGEALVTMPFTDEPEPNTRTSDADCKCSTSALEALGQIQTSNKQERAGG
jgi:hypothetical protein